MSTPIGQTFVGGDQAIRDVLRPGVGHRASGRILGVTPTLFGEQLAPTRVNTLMPFSGMGTMVAETVSRTTPSHLSEHIELILGSRDVPIDDPFRQLAEWPIRVGGEQPAAIGIKIPSHTFPQIFTPAAMKYARSLGLYGSLVMTTQIILENFSPPGAIHVDVKKDPDEGGYTTICFTITTTESVDRVLELDDVLQDALYDRIQPDHHSYISFAYHFEKVSH